MNFFLGKVFKSHWNKSLIIIIIQINYVNVLCSLKWQVWNEVPPEITPLKSTIYVKTPSSNLIDTTAFFILHLATQLRKQKHTLGKRGME